MLMSMDGNCQFFPSGDYRRFDNIWENNLIHLKLMDHVYVFHGHGYFVDHVDRPIIVAFVHG